MRDKRRATIFGIFMRSAYCFFEVPLMEHLPLPGSLRTIWDGMKEGSCFHYITLDACAESPTLSGAVMQITSKKFLKSLASVALGMNLFACAPGFEGTYSDPAKAEIVDDRWSETDARKTADSLISQVLGKPWLPQFEGARKQKPVVIVDEVANRTDEHIDTKALTEFMTDELINSGKVRFVNADKRQKILDEIKYQNSGTTSGATKKTLGKQIGADFLLSGAISSSVHTQDGLKTVTYQTALTMTDLETAEIVWSGKELIKKRFNRSSSKW